MVQMFRLKYTGNTDKRNTHHAFTVGQEYVGRIAKSGVVMAYNDEKRWVVIRDFRMTRLGNMRDFDVLEKFYVNNHKEALAYTERNESE